ncbi:hypothetical protein PSEUBRA_000159 [Kalmanozyma brasiliensis GHG001]|uniref:uncharacterized protein n=1 Tax=Kalmanozyma brasiliensis (strain GHG001) TaxID=1365824 RepID=UPI002867E213|nr:uncharacterized protein PSEUBRA_000159 [Kalmanozyma brasiliensis GHG001]KAF6766784.1 hypothetical protein PSEUBRA_000159 [Kalmanozyma brasiliensis GHG001]
MAARQYEFCDLQQNGLQWQETLHNDVQDIPERIAEQLSETTSKIYDVAEATHHLAGIRDDLNHLKITVAGMTPLAKDRHEAYEKQIAELQDVVQTLRNSIHEQPVRISESLQQFAAEVAEQQYERLRTELRDDRMSRDEHRQEIRELQGMLVGLRTMLVQPEGSRASTSQAASTSTPRRILVPSTPDRLLEDIVAHDYDPPAMDSDPAPLDSASQCGQRVMGHGREADARPEHAADDDVDFTDYEALPNALKRTTGRRASQVQTPRDQQTVEPPPSAPAPRKSGQAGGRKTPKGSRKYASTSKKRALPAELEDGEDKDRYLQHASPNRPGRTFDLAVGLQEAEDECSEQQQAPSADPKPAAQRSRTRPAAAKAPKRGRGKQSANQAKIAESFEGAPRYQTRKQTRDLHLQDNLLSPLA